MRFLTQKRYTVKCQFCGVTFYAKSANRKACNACSETVKYRGHDSSPSTLCDICQSPIPAARLAAVPNTHLCVACKALHDEPALRPDSPVLRGSLVETSVSDLAEMQKQARELVSNG